MNRPITRRELLRLAGLAGATAVAAACGAAPTATPVPAPTKAAAPADCRLQPLPRPPRRLLPSRRAYRPTLLSLTLAFGQH